MRECKKEATASQWDAFILKQAEAINAANSPANPLHSSEVRATAKSVARWAWTRFDIAASDARFSRLQACRGKKGGVASGVARLAKSEDKRASAKLMHFQGMAKAAIARELGVPLPTVISWLRNAEPSTDGALGGVSAKP